MPPLALMTVLAFSPSSAPIDDRPAPPFLPDAAHVINGCYISAVAYVARFAAAYPWEKACSAEVRIRNRDGKTRVHTIVLVTWRNRWWGRDEFCGVFALDETVRESSPSEAIRKRAERRLDRLSDEIAKNPSLPMSRPVPRVLPAEQRAREVAVARELLPLPSEQFWALCEDAEIPFLLFRPAARSIAVYDPLCGVATAEVDCDDGGKIVAAVAAKLGYRVTRIRAEPRPAR